jgi:hypothetical protein
MPSYRTALPRKYYSAADLDTPLTLTIRTVQIEKLDTGEDRLVARFVEPGTKGLVLNQTRCESIAALAGSDDYVDWAGLRVQLVRARTRYKGVPTDCVGVVAPPKQDAKKRPAVNRPSTPNPDDGEGFGEPLPDPEAA